MSRADIDAIHSIREETERAENRGDADFFRAHCTDDLVVMPPGMPAVFGKEAAVEFMREFFRQFAFRIEYTSQETQIHGDVALDRGAFFHTPNAKAGG